MSDPIEARLAAALAIAAAGEASPEQHIKAWTRQMVEGMLEADPTLAADLALAEKARVARAVAQVWLDVVMASDVLRGSGMSHPPAMVLAAFDGETDPVHLGCDPDALKAAKEASE